MKGLLYKEFVQNKSSLLMIAAPIVFITFPLTIMIVLPGENDEGAALVDGMAVLISAFTCFLDFVILSFSLTDLFKGDERRKWSYFALSTPAGVERIVWTKYVFVLMLYGVLGMFLFFSERLLLAITGIDFTCDVVMVICFYVFLLIAALDIPFVLRYGTSVGTAYKGILLGGVLLVLLIYFLFGDMSIFASTDDLYAFLDQLLSGKIPDGVHITLALLPVVSIAAYYVSYRISCRLYRKGVASYDK